MLLKATIVLLLLAPIAYADEWAKTYEVTGVPQLHIETSDANIQVDTWDQNRIEARVITHNWKIGSRGIKIYDHQGGDAVALGVRFPHTVFALGLLHRSVDIRIRMPKEARLDLHTSDGSIKVNGTKGEMALTSGDGNLEIEGVDGILRATTGDGRVRARGRFDVLEIKTGDGGIEASALSGSKMAAGWTLHTGDGSLTLRLPEDFRAEVDLHTSDGHIDLGLPIAISGRVGNKTLRGEINGGGELLRLKSGDGSIRLERL